MIATARRLPDTLAALRAAKTLEAHDAWSPEHLRAHQQERLVALVRHAAAHSPFHRERLAGIALDDDLDVTALPALDKATMLEHFDELVTDRRLRLTAIEAHLDELEHRPHADDLFLGEYRAMASGGTTGRRGVFVYGREDWTQAIGGLLRWSGGFMGLTPRLPRRRRLASVVADVPLHMTARMARTLDVGVHRMLRLDARRPVSELVGPLNAFAPEGLTAYASVAALLADEQLAGRLRIDPATVAVTSEVLTADMRERIEAAWGCTPFNGYASTETGMLATSCERHEGLHVLSDLNLLEVVDAGGRPVPPGTQGAKVLVTNLVNRTQPLIRMELSDLVTVSPATCSCGRPYPLLETVDGRSDDILVLPAAGGGTVSVHPLTLRSPLAALPDLRQYRIVHDASGLTVEAVIGAGNGETGAEIERRLTAALAERGAGGTPVTVTQVEAIERHPGSGKAKLVESRV
ncbi:MAG: hypothetical protein MUC84_08735 [Solirubrobacteraceae bacterium]|nr:hypothetical protein [Solirubrobacteraceae bacterium]